MAGQARAPGMVGTAERCAQGAGQGRRGRRHLGDHPEHRRAAPARWNAGRAGAGVARDDVRRGCVGCGDRTEMAAALDRVRGGEADPACLRCGGILKSATVMFGQPLDPVVLARAVRAAQDCDLMLAIGSTLTVEPAASLCAVAVDHGASLVVVNRDPTPYDEMAAEVITKPIGIAVPRIADLLAAGRSS